MTHLVKLKIYLNDCSTSVFPKGWPEVSRETHILPTTIVLSVAICNYKLLLVQGQNFLRSGHQTTMILLVLSDTLVLPSFPEVIFTNI